MAIDPKLLINTGSQENDGTGDSIRTAFEKVNTVFENIYGANGASPIGFSTSTYVIQAQLTSTYSVSTGSDHVLPLSATNDVNNWWTTTVTNVYAFQPDISGYYQYESSALWGVGSGSGQNNTQVKLNGTTISIAEDVVNTVQPHTQVNSGIIYLNGVTDQLTVTAYTDSLNQSLSGGVATRFSALMVGSNNSNATSVGTFDQSSATNLLGNLDYLQSEITDLQTTATAFANSNFLGLWAEG